jgi:hypothetical protein
MINGIDSMVLNVLFNITTAGVFGGIGMRTN